MKKHTSQGDRALLAEVLFLDIYNQKYVNGEVLRTATQIKCLWTLLSVSFISFTIGAGAWVGDIPDTAKPIIVMTIFLMAFMALSWLVIAFIQEKRIATTGKLMKAHIIKVELMPGYNENKGVTVHYEFVSPSGKIFQKREDGPNTPSPTKVIPAF